MNTVKTLFQYFIKRFHLIPLTLLVISDIVVVRAILKNEVLQFIPYLLAFLFVLLYLFHNRVGDDKRDFAFDAKYYPTRAVQKGKISLALLDKMAWITYVLMGAIMLLMDVRSLLIGIPLLGFAWWAKKDFHLPESFKERYFFTYNLLNMLQMFFLQVFIYFALQPFQPFDQLIWVHIAFVFVLSLQIEVTRKIHHQKYPANDQYSDRLGVTKSLLLWLFFGLLGVVLSFYLATMLHVETQTLWAVEGIVVFVLLVGALIFNKKSSAENLFWLCSISSYIGQNLLLAYG